jgi:hypothetical protein
MSTERILQHVERLSYLIGQHAGLLTHLETELPPYHEDTIAALRQQFEAHIGFLLVNLESYTSLQPTPSNSTLHTLSPRHTSYPPPLQFLRKPHQLPGETLAQGTTHTTPYV